ncbi:MAG: undecaprenyl-diphosphate phosphatase [Candidatus Saccharimonas sp.]
MDILHAILLGIVEGITEFLPISSTGHLTIVEKLLGYQIDAPEITAFTAVIQIGAILAAVLYFWKDIVSIVAAWWKGLWNKDERTTGYLFGWAVIVGSLPIVLVAFLLKDQIETVFRSLWFVVGGLIVWSGIMWIADWTAKQERAETTITWKDTLVIGAAQCLALIPGVSRSGATISTGLLRGFDRVTATRLSFFLGIPALVAAGLFESVTKAGDISHGIGWLPTIIATVTSFIVGYISIAWLLKFVSKHNFSLFIWYRILLGMVIALLLVSGTISAT